MNFFFTAQASSEEWGKKQKFLQILNHTVPNFDGEDAIKMKNNCREHQIPTQSHLSENLMIAAVPKKIVNHFELKADPTLIES